MLAENSENVRGEPGVGSTITYLSTWSRLRVPSETAHSICSRVNPASRSAEIILARIASPGLNRPGSGGLRIPILVSQSKRSTVSPVSVESSSAEEVRVTGGF